MAQISSQSLGITDNVNSFNYSVVTNPYNIINVNTGISDEDGRIREWLSPLKPQQRHQDVRADRLDGVGNWLLETSEFRKWSNGDDGYLERVLFCSGGPGVGKTYLSSLVIDSLCDQAEEKDLAVAWLYCDFLAHQEQSATNMLGAILKQLVSIGEIPENVRQAFRKRFSSRGLRLPDIGVMLKATIPLLPQVYICIDALDESTPKNRQELLESLRDIVRGSPSTRVLFTGRCHVEEEVKRYFPQAIIVPVRPTIDDIRVYLSMRLDGDTEHEAMDDDLRRDIMRVIPEMISGVFLLVSLNIDAILGEVTIYKRRKKLEEMAKGKGLGDAYTATITRIKSQNGSRSRLGMEALMWVSHSERPLKGVELCHALGVERGETDQNGGNIPAIESVLRCSLGLITIEASSSTVRLVHITLQEHLSNASSVFCSAHSMMAEVCLTFLNFQCIRDLSPTLDPPPVATPFVGYASCYWGTHARRELNEDVKLLALKLLDSFDKHVSSKLLLIHEKDWWWHRSTQEGSNTPEGFTGLHGAAYLGLVEIADALLMREWDLNATDVERNTAFSWAARKGHKEMVKMLLERRDVNPDTTNTDGRTPLSWAAACGHEGVVEMLVERVDVNPDTRDKYGQTPLSSAAEYGREGVVNILVKRMDVNPNTIDRYDRTPLSWAISNGHGEVVKLLLERVDIKPDTRDINGLTPLSQAAWDGHEGVVMMLLGRVDVNPDTADIRGQTPLSFAAACGREGIVKILLERADVSPCARDKDGLTPLSWAAKVGQEGVLRMLLGREDVNPDTTDNYGQTPLFVAAQKGHKEVMKILLERVDVDPNTADQHGQAPLFIAAWKGHEGGVKMLLERVDVNPNTADKYGQTPLFIAAREGHREVVKMFLERVDVNPNTADKYGQTPLFIAAREGHREVVKMLLERVDVNPNTAEEERGRTPLFVAAREGHREVVKMLLERVDVNPNTADQHGQTPLFIAAWKGHEGVVKMLLERVDVNPNTADKYGRTPLFRAAQEGHGEVVKVLLEQVDVNPTIADQDGQTPLFIAASDGYEGIVEMLLERADANSTTADLDGETALPRDLESGHDTVVKLLSQRKNLILQPDGDKSIVLFSPESPDPDQRPSKRVRMC